MSDDWQLAQGTVEFRQAERDHANGRDRSPTRCRLCGDPAYLCACEDEVSIAAAGDSPTSDPAAAEGDKTR